MFYIIIYILLTLFLIIGVVGKKFLAMKNKKNVYCVKRRLQFPTRRAKKIKCTGPDEFYGLAEPLAPEERMTTELMIEKKQ